MKYCLLVFSFLLLSACVTSVEMRKTDFAFSDRLQAKQTFKADTFLFGLIQGSDTIKVWEQCRKDWQEVRITRSFWHVTVTLFTLGIYTPMRVIIICDSQTDGPQTDGPQTEGSQTDDDEFKLFESKEHEEQEEQEEQDQEDLSL